MRSKHFKATDLPVQNPHQLATFNGVDFMKI